MPNKVLLRLNRESRENRERSRRCNRVRNLLLPLHGITMWEGAEIRKIRESEDLPFR